jgi:hypothetical protein
MVEISRSSTVGLISATATSREQPRTAKPSGDDDDVEQVVAALAGD